MTVVQASQGPSTKDSPTSNERKRQFLKTFQRWERLFRRKDGDPESDRWLIAEYYRSLAHLTPAGLDRLTEVLKGKCTFFPSIAECLAETRCSRWDWDHPFAAAEDFGLFYSGSGKCRHALADQQRRADTAATLALADKRPKLLTGGD